MALFVVLLSALARGASGTAHAGALPVIGIHDFRMHVGDVAGAALPGFDDAGFSPVSLAAVPQAPDVVWLRATVDVSRLDRRALQPLALFFAGMASHEIYWDGVLVGRGGIVGTSPAMETPGPIQAMYTLPETAVSATRHTLALRLSSFHRGFSPRRGLWTVLVGDSPTLTSWLARETWLSLTALSGILLATLFAFAMFLVNDRDRGFLLLGTLGLSVAALLLAESWRSLVGYTYDRHLLRLLVVTALSWLVSVELVAFVVTRFPSRDVRRSRIALALPVVAGGLAAFLSPSWDGKALSMLALGITTSLVWAAAAAMQRRKGARLVLLGLTPVFLGLVLGPFGFASVWIFFLVHGLFVCLLVAHALDVRDARRSAVAVELRSARLEIEVLRRQLQPHVLLNTLTSLSEWVEQEPKTAVRMIESLADELRLLNDVASRRLIPLADELALCRAHLATMGFRRDVRYTLRTVGLDERDLVPPAVFHTLVENAASHGFDAPDVALCLSATRSGRWVRYRFESPTDPGRSTLAPRTGTGTRYIEARLREAWGDAFTFTQGREGTTWVARIRVPATTPREAFSTAGAAVVARNVLSAGVR